MKILFVAMSNSVHTVRWINQLSDQNWDVHLYPSIDIGFIDRKLKNITAYYTVYSSNEKITRDVNPSIKQRGFYIPKLICGLNQFFKTFVNSLLNRYLPNYRIYQLRSVIKKVNPDIIHSLELQHAGYLTYMALHQNVQKLSISNIIKNIFRRLIKSRQGNDSSPKPFSEKRIEGKTSKWVVTTWGSDLYLYGRLEEHKDSIKRVLDSIDYLSCDCKRDFETARSLGYKKEILPTPSVLGGFDFERLSKLRKPGLISDRRTIMLKGYQSWSGRALVGLRALERCADILQGYTLVLYLCEESVKIAAELFSQSTGVPVKILNFDANDHDQIFRNHGEARISIGLGISDGLPASLLEAMVMGSFPIQSDTSAADEVVSDGKTVLLVPPNDPSIIEKAIRRALSDDNLVNIAAEENWKTITEKFDSIQQKNDTIQYYNNLMNKNLNEPEG